MSESISITIPATPVACAIFGAAIDAYGKTLITPLGDAPLPVGTVQTGPIGKPTVTEIINGVDAPAVLLVTPENADEILGKGSEMAAMVKTIPPAAPAVVINLDPVAPPVDETKPVNININTGEKVVFPPVTFNPPVDEPVEPPTELDAAGFPWDERIHAKTKTFMKDGTWKKGRGVDQALVDQVRAETASVPFDAPPVMPPEVAAALEPVAPPAATSPAIDSALTFPGLILGITNAVKTGRCVQGAMDAVVAQVCTELEIININVLAQRPELLDAAYAMIKPVLG